MQCPLWLWAALQDSCSAYSGLAIQDSFDLVAPSSQHRGRARASRRDRLFTQAGSASGRFLSGPSQIEAYDPSLPQDCEADSFAVCPGRRGKAVHICGQIMFINHNSGPKWKGKEGPELKVTIYHHPTPAINA